MMVSPELILLVACGCAPKRRFYRTARRADERSVIRRMRFLPTPTIRRNALRFSALQMLNQHSMHYDRRRRILGLSAINGVADMPCTTTEIETTVSTMASSFSATAAGTPAESMYIR